MSAITVKHDVIADAAGFSGHSRLTCNSCQRTLVRQPYMNEERWTTMRAEFLAAHPSETIRIDRS